MNTSFNVCHCAILYMIRHLPKRISFFMITLDLLEAESDMNQLADGNSCMYTQFNSIQFNSILFI